MIPDATFDPIAAGYDADFTDTQLGRRKRGIVHEYLFRKLRPDWRVLELNCGTGEDAVAIAGHVASVVATDISAGMVETGQRKAEGLKSENGHDLNLRFRQMDIAALWDSGRHRPIEADGPFDLIFSNFDGLNCLPDLEQLPDGLRSVLAPEGEAIVVFMSPFCAVETLGNLLRGRFREAFARPRGLRAGTGAQVSIGHGRTAETWFHSISELIRNFRGGGFSIVAVRAVGLTTPPTTMRDFYHRHRKLFAGFEWLENLLSPMAPWNRMGDHVLIHVRRLDSK